MKLFVVLCVMSIAPAFACRGGNSASNVVVVTTPTAIAEGTDTPTGSAGSDGGQLVDALLTTGELPAGWSEMPDGVSPASGNSKLCNLELDLFTASNVTEKASRSFTKGGRLGPFFGEGISTFPGSDAAKGLSTFREAMKSCKQVTEPINTGGDTTVAYSLEEASFPTLGDESIAFRLTSAPTRSGPGFEADFVFIRHEHSLLYVVNAGFGFTGLDTDQWVALARRADDKVRNHGIR